MTPDQEATHARRIAGNTGSRPHSRGWVWLAVALPLLVFSLPGRLAAQDELSNAPWRDSFYPFFPSLGNNFPLIALHLEERKAADYFARNNYAGLFSVDVGQGFTGARMAVARFHAPLLRRDWRLLSSIGTTRETRLGYFGLGNDTRDDESLVTKSQPHYYEARRARYFGNLEISRRIVGPLWIAGAGGVEYSNLSDLSGPSLFRTDLGTGDISDTDVRGRVTLVLDTRDNEFNTTRGFFAQASVGGGTGGDGYSRVTADVRGYVSVREGTVLAFQRLAGKGVLFASGELRHNLLDLGDFGAFTLFGFVDAGRVFEQEKFELTTRDMKVGAGGGLAIRLLRFTIWTFNFAGGPDGFQFSAGSGWAF
jgi:hypothetical protein